MVVKKFIGLSVTVIAAMLVQYGSVICVDAKEEVLLCSVSGYIHSDPACEHQYVKTISKEAACGQEGEKIFTCTLCGESYIEPIPARDHNYGDWVVEERAAVGKEGSRYRECTLCHKRVYETIPALLFESFGKMEAAVTSANILLWILLFLLLTGEFSLLGWERRKKQEILRDKKFLESGEDGYESI